MREQHGVVPSTFMIDKVLAKMTKFVAQAPEQRILCTSFQEKLAKAPGLPAATKAQLLAATKQQLGAKFDRRDFHDAVLRNKW